MRGDTSNHTRRNGNGADGRHDHPETPVRIRSGHPPGWLLAVAGLCIAVVLSMHALNAWVARTELPSLLPETSVEILDRRGDLLRPYTVDDGIWRLDIELESVSHRYLDLLLAYEDKRFHAHSGVDLLAAGRAFWQVLRYGRMVSGASTITMQTARLLEASGTGSWRGKLRQIRLALALERHVSKEDILGLYVQLAPFGGNLEGVRAASLAYFGKEPTRLDLSEAALLVALPQAPEARRPDRFRDAARAARDRVLDRALERGLAPLDAVQRAKSTPPPDRRRDFPALAAHLSDRIAASAPERRIHRLTLDKRLQSKLQTLAARHVDRSDPQATVAIVVADHQTGEILGHVGNAHAQGDGRPGWIDMTRAVRSPGSTLKPLIYGLAFADGLAHPDTLIDDLPATFSGYRPTNFDGQFRGTVTIRDALSLSLNIPAVRLTGALGPHRLVAALKRSGAAVHLPGQATPGLAVALGGVGVTLEGLVALYAAIGNGGLAVDLSPHPRESDPGRPVLSPEAAWYITDILRNIPPPHGASDLGIAYKTGTSYGYRDAWAVGFDGRHVVGIWTGRADGTPIPAMSGATSAAPLLFEVFARLGARPSAHSAPPDTVLQVSGGRLPKPLRVFGRPLDKVAANAPRVVFPPDRAQFPDLEIGVRVQAGTPPFLWMVNGTPQITRSRRRNDILTLSPGWHRVTVVDSVGKSASVTVSAGRLTQ